MNEFEYVTPMKKCKELTLKKAGLIGLYALVVICWFAFGFATNLYPLLCFIPLSLWVVVYFTWRYVSVEFEYTIRSGVMSAYLIYGGKKKKQVVEVPLKDAALIASVATHASSVEEFAPEQKFSVLPAKDCYDAYFVLFEKDGKKSVLYFEATEKALKTLKYFNSAATVVGKTSY